MHATAIAFPAEDLVGWEGACRFIPWSEEADSSDFDQARPRTLALGELRSTGGFAPHDGSRSPF